MPCHELWQVLDAFYAAVCLASPHRVLSLVILVEIVQSGMSRVSRFDVKKDIVAHTNFRVSPSLLFSLKTVHVTTADLLYHRSILK